MNRAYTAATDVFNVLTLSSAEQLGHLSEFLNEKVTLVSENRRTDASIKVRGLGTIKFYSGNYLINTYGFISTKKLEKLMEICDAAYVVDMEDTNE
jgi:hypothetical protein